ncbi:MAG: plastocyanin/azurin family copper-binding protein [Bacteroidota bacterium]
MYLLKWAHRPHHTSWLWSLPFVFLLAGCGPGEVRIEIAPEGNQLKYATQAFEVRAGQAVRLVMNNTATAAPMVHNVVILRSDADLDAVINASAGAADTGFIPDHPAIIAATPTAQPGERTETQFVAPAEVGEYPFVCLYPGHYFLMRGVMRVTP